jgi:hypothetical protein
MTARRRLVRVHPGWRTSMHSCWRRSSSTRPSSTTFVGLVREALLDTRALPGNLCRLIPPFTPSGMTLMTFEGCGNSGDGAMRGRSIASASCAVSLQAPRAGGCTGNGSRASLKPQESVDCPNAATLRERVSAAFAINALISSSCMLADTAYAQWKTKYEIVSSRISWL